MLRERFSTVDQELGQKIWTIVRLFYSAHGAFKEQFAQYETKVGSYSQLLGIPRADLRLNSQELASLLDLKTIERLRDGYVHELKDLCHLVFRGQDRTDLLDRYVSDIFHETSILKEEHYNVITYAPLYERDEAEVELRHILDEAHTMFPHKLQHIRYLFGRAQARLEEHLASFSSIQLFIRSLYLHRDRFVREAYEDGLDEFYRLMYPMGPFQGYFEVGRGFYFAGFDAQAREAFALAEEAYRKQLFTGRVSGKSGSSGELRDALQSLRSKVGRLVAADAR